MDVQLTVEPDTDSNRGLVDAVRNLDLEAVRTALDQGASADARVRGYSGPEGTPVAMLATTGIPDDKARALSVFRLLIEHVSNPNAADENFGTTLLIWVADLNDLESVKRLVEKGANVNARGSHFAKGMTALSMAASFGGVTAKGRSPVIEYLLEQGAEVNVQDEQGRTALMIAAQYGKVEVVRALLARDADLTLRDQIGYTALRWANRMRQGEVVRILREHTPMDLHEAAQFGHMDRARAALEAGADPSGIDRHGATTLMVAARSETVEVAKLLLEEGAKIGPKDRSGRTALHHAAQYGQAALAELLLEKGADPNISASEPGTYDAPGTPLTDAAMQAEPEVVELLLRRGVNLEQHGQGTAALEHACRCVGQRPDRLREARATPPLSEQETLARRVRVIELLLQEGVDVRAHGAGALFWSAFLGHRGLVRVLLDGGADVNARGVEGKTALMASIQAWMAAIGLRMGLESGEMMNAEPEDARKAESVAKQTVDLLLERGADVDLADAAGEAPLHQCARFDLRELARTLLAKGASVSPADLRGRTPLMRAAAVNVPRMAEFLLEHGADPNQRDAKGCTALMLAVDDGANEAYRRNREETDAHRRRQGYRPRPISRHDLPNPDGHPEMVRLLLEHGADVNAVSNDGQTALKLARKEGFEAVVAMLKEAGAA